MSGDQGVRSRLKGSCGGNKVHRSVGHMYCAISNILRPGSPMVPQSKVIEASLGVRKANREAECMKARPCSIQIVLLVSHPKPKVRTSDEVLSALPSCMASAIATCLAFGSMRRRFPLWERRPMPMDFKQSWCAQESKFPSTPAARASKPFATHLPMAGHSEAHCDEEVAACQK